MAFSRSLVALVAVLPACLQAAPAIANTAYVKPTVMVVAAPNDPYAGALRSDLANWPRIVFVDLPGGPLASLDFDLRRAADVARRAAGSPAFIFAIRSQVSRQHCSEPVPEETKVGGVITTTVHSDLHAEIQVEMEVIDATSGQVIRRFRTDRTASRRYEYQYTSAEQREVRERRLNDFNIALRHELDLPTREALGREIDGQTGLVAVELMGDIQQLEAFKLKGAVTGWDSRNDSIAIDLGRSLGLAVDEGFRLVHDGRSVGYLKVRRLGPNDSETQPLFMNGPLALGDRVEENPKLNLWQSLKAGVLWMGRPAAIGTYSGQLDLGGLSGLSELYATYDGSLVASGPISGEMGEFGLMKKFFFRRWGVSLGAKGGVIKLNGLSGQTVEPGGALATGLDCYLTPDFVWSSDLEFQLYKPIVQSGGSGSGTMVQPFGPMLRTGLTAVF